MRISEFYRSGKPVFSFEFFPPKTPEAEEKLFETAGELKRLAPFFISVTYGAMGSTRHNTLRIACEIKKRFGIEAAAHLTCVGQTREDITSVLEELRNCGIENIVALRGDPPKGESEYRPVEGGFAYASELVKHIRSQPAFKDAFDLAVAGYPECHIECRDPARDLQHLKMKVDAGADAVITQLFFDNRDFFSFEERARKAGIRVPIVAGIMPVTHGGQIKRFSEMCGSKIPQTIQDAIDRYGDDQASIEAMGIEYATKQCRELLQHGIAGIHFYTLNKSKATREIYHNLGLDHPPSGK